MAISPHLDRQFTRLRDHPSLNWPPIWTNGTRKVGDEAHGEIGVLRYVHFSNSNSYKCFLVIEHENEHFVGTLVFHDLALHRQITDLLEHHIGCSTKDIGNLEIPPGKV
jgi:hypothetical protein